MIFGKHVNKFYLRYWYLLIGGIIALLAVIGIFFIDTTIGVLGFVALTFYSIMSYYKRKSVIEHLEVINHKDAILFLEELVKSDVELSEWNIIFCDLFKANGFANDSTTSFKEL